MRYLIFALLIVTTNVFAQPYVFVEAGFADGKTDAASKIGGSYKRAGAGYAFNRWLAAEINYLDADGSDTEQSGAVSTSRKWEAKGWGAALAGKMPISGGFSLTGKLGAQKLDAHLHTVATQSLVITLADTIEEKTGWAPLVNIGARYDITPAFGIGIALEQIGGVGPIDRIRSVGAMAFLSF